MKYSILQGGIPGGTHMLPPGAGSGSPGGPWPSQVPPHPGGGHVSLEMFF